MADDERIAGLSASERLVYDLMVNAIERGIPAPKSEDLMVLIGCASLSTPPTIVKRLEEMGLLNVERFQRSRQVCDPVTGKCTARPANTAPHWRDRPRDVPSVTLGTVRQRRPDIAGEIMTWAAKRGVPICDAIADLAYVGWQVEKERG